MIPVNENAMRVAALLIVALLMGFVSGCGSSPEKKQNKNFFTSGSREADQRAQQRMAKSEQLTGQGEGAGEKDVKKAKPAEPKKAESKAGAPTGREAPKPAQAEKKLSLFERLGGDAGLTKIVEDFTPRAMQDPRVNWDRKGVTEGGFLGMHKKPVTWNATPENVAQLKKHMIEFLALATGGPVHYEGKEMKSAHANMQISNPEFDAVVGDLKASLDKLQIPNQEQKELLAIIESTRPEIVTER